ncbi:MULTISPECIES: hypothetical protein [Streptomyces]|uniref:Uncharacterized protein n=1 Tax=Streptomyces spororaveus TaxID=284039 RepID=A0ABQ3TMZ6_9ACTN|nr:MULTISPECIES: hypothetical protein [Streptomyces]MCM9077850.1 hypothetical protein [Streptomyces spororaveus]MCX5307671.1 hypothetical protein [Streptomyces sp. NBC_00160]GHI81799.1 hypothetical protein Sspor_73600 [Streptomyces spororaveus]
MTSPRDDEPFLTLHTTVVLLVCLLVGGAAGVLTHLGGIPPALSVLAGLTAAGSALPVARGLIR